MDGSLALDQYQPRWSQLRRTEFWKKIIRFNIKFVIYQFKLLDLLESNNNQP